jgi:hypothetical protein
MEGDQFQITKYIHNNHCYSLSHAIKYEGYEVRPN